MSSKLKKIRIRARHDRLLRLFDGEGYEIFETPKYVFVKQWNGNNKTWEVAIYPRDSWNRKEEGARKHAEYTQQTDFFRNIMNEV